MQIEIEGKKINYEVEGEGWPVVLLHGWLASLETMKPIANFLKQYFKVYNIDIIGFGKSDLPDEPLDTNAFGDFFKKLLQELQVENPILIGHSNGRKNNNKQCRKRLSKPKKISTNR